MCRRRGRRGEFDDGLDNLGVEAHGEKSGADTRRAEPGKGPRAPLTLGTLGGVGRLGDQRLCTLISGQPMEIVLSCLTWGIPRFSPLISYSMH